MSAKASPARIGAFVVGAIALVLVGLIAFGSGTIFEQRRRFVAYFEGSVTGLRAGAPVAFRGVPIGQVTSVQVRYDPSDGSTEVPVFFETTKGRIDMLGDVPDDDVAEEIQKMIDLGLRARLAPQSFVTGQLFIEVLPLPDTPARLVGADPDVVEIPTVPSQFDVLSGRLESLLGSGDTEEGIKGVTDGVTRLLNPENQRAVAEILASIARFAKVLGEGDAAIAATLDNARDLTARADAAALDLQGLIADLRAAAQAYNEVAGVVLENEAKFERIGETFVATTESVGRMADQINTAVAENRPGLLDFTENTLPAVDGLVLDLEQLAQQLSRVADQLERDPSGFLFGGQPPRGIQTP
jgi:paraquat-inducible protein B